MNKIAEFKVEEYIVSHDVKNGFITLFGLPEYLQVEMIEEFVFFITHNRRLYKVNVHTNNNKQMVVKDFDHKPEKVKKRR